VTEKIVVAGGCFWDMRDAIRKHPGVIAIRVEGVGANRASVTGRTRSEAIEITFDSEQTSCAELLRLCFRSGDGVTPGLQSRDVGTSYRSATLYLDDEQRRVAEGAYVSVAASGFWSGNVIW
jgi:peptide-methionine (S)-S-oxide reductase